MVERRIQHRLTNALDVNTHEFLLASETAHIVSWAAHSLVLIGESPAQVVRPYDVNSPVLVKTKIVNLNIATGPCIFEYQYQNKCLL